MNVKNRLRYFFFPDISLKYIIRLICIAVVTYLIFTFIFVPLKIKGNSMSPTYKDGQINICFRLKYLFSEPKRTDVVVVRYAGNHIMLLKRIVALEGEQIEFQNGRLVIDGQIKEELYVEYPYKWNLLPRQVEKGNVYLVGDNRNVPMERHDFGQTSTLRIIGAPLW
ncbi:MAG: signal peptidase I [Deltaproteobacteria bacterium]|nr:signal peptidase I [Deltaproteobacteria bacterium]MBW1846495.1 signal peptidase I [Deltaproteobacteria bacterium]